MAGTTGTCRKAASDLKSKPSSAPFYLSNRYMTYWSANNLCQVMDMHLALLSDFGCSDLSSSGWCDTSNVTLMDSAYGYF